MCVYPTEEKGLISCDYVHGVAGHRFEMNIESFLVIVDPQKCSARSPSCLSDSAKNPQV